MSQNHRVSVLQTYFFNRLHHLTVERIRYVWNHQPDRQCPPRAQAPRHIARMIAQIVNRLQHSLPCFERNRTRTIVDDVRDR